MMRFHFVGLHWNYDSGLVTFRLTISFRTTSLGRAVVLKVELGWRISDTLLFGVCIYIDM